MLLKRIKNAEGVDIDPFFDLTSDYLTSPFSPG